MTLYLGLGSNLGDREATLRQAVRLLAERFTVVAVSGLYETAPVGYTDQPAFLNAVVACDTDAAPEQALAWCQAVEAALGRQRTVRWGPRTLDVDLLLWDDRAIDTPALVVPHPRLHQRAFALAPLAELAADAMVPGAGQTVAELLSAVGTAGVTRVVGPEWTVG